MSDITLITPPDKVFNQSKSILLIYPSEQSKLEIQSILAKATEHYNIYLYNQDADVDWLLSVHKFCEKTFIDIDNMPSELSKLVPYLISFNDTFWLTKGEQMYYNKISINRVYDFEFLKPWIGGDVGEK